MANPKSPGRMIRRSIAVSRGVANLGPEATAIYCMVIPHLDSHGKMLGSPATVKETALPFAKWATVEVIEQALQEINCHTNLKWWMDRDGRRYIHAVHFEKHQDLREDRRGADHFPNFPGEVPDLVPNLVRPKVKEVEVKKRESENNKPRTMNPCEAATSDTPSLCSGDTDSPPTPPLGGISSRYLSREELYRTTDPKSCIE